MNALQGRIAVLFRHLTELNSLLQVAFNRFQSALNRAGVDVAHDDLATASRGDLSDAVAHRARAEHTNSMNWASHRGFVVCVRVCAQRPASMCAEPYKGDANLRPRLGWGRSVF